MKTLLLIGGLAALAGCASPTPQFDETFGNAVRAARLAQTLNPDAGADDTVAPGLDGKAAKLAIDRYHDSFKAPPPVTNVINIGGGISGGGK